MNNGRLAFNFNAANPAEIEWMNSFEPDDNKHLCFPIHFLYLQRLDQFGDRFFLGFIPFLAVDGCNQLPRTADDELLAAGSKRPNPALMQLDFLDLGRRRRNAQGEHDEHDDSRHEILLEGSVSWLTSRC